MKISNSIGVTGGQQNTLAAAIGGLGYTYTWAIDSSIAQPFAPGTGSSAVPYNKFNSAYDTTQVAGTEGGWRFDQNGTIDAINAAFTVGGFQNDENLTAGATYVGSDAIPSGVISTTNKYYTIVMTIHSHTGLTTSEFLESGPDAFVFLNMLRIDSEAGGSSTRLHYESGQNPPSHINGVEVSTSGGSVLDSNRSDRHGLLTDGSEIGSKLSISYDLSRDPHLSDPYDVNLMHHYLVNTGTGNGTITGLNFTIHGIILGPDPVPDLTGKGIEIDNPIPV